MASTLLLIATILLVLQASCAFFISQSLLFTSKIGSAKAQGSEKCAERTFVALKPDAVERKLVGQIIQRIEQKGFKLSGMKLLQAPVEIVQKHYAEHEGKPFYPELVNFFLSGPVVAMVWEGENVVQIMRMLVGKTHPEDALPGTIRGDFCSQRGKNLVHSSDSIESAQREIDIWFEPTELL